MPTLADRTITALRTGHDRLAARVRELRPEQLTGPSGAAEWDVSQVLSHLGSGAEIGLAGLEAALAGAEPPGMDFNKGVWARWDAMSPTDRSAGFAGANEKLVARFEALSPEQRAELPVRLPWLPAPVDVATAAGFRLTEFALHEWDVTVGLDPAATVAPEAAGLLVDRVADLVGFIGTPAALGERRATLEVRLSDPARTLGLTLGEPISIGEAPTTADGTLTAPTEAWLRLLTGRLPARYTPAGVTVDGATSLDDLRAVFPGY